LQPHLGREFQGAGAARDHQRHGRPRRRPDRARRGR
jgi:hypothetical protein